MNISCYGIEIYLNTKRFINIYLTEENCMDLWQIFFKNVGMFKIVGSTRLFEWQHDSYAVLNILNNSPPCRYIF